MANSSEDAESFPALGLALVASGDSAGPPGEPSSHADASSTRAVLSPSLGSKSSRNESKSAERSVSPAGALRGSGEGVTDRAGDEPADDMAASPRSRGTEERDTDVAKASDVASS